MSEMKEKEKEKGIVPSNEVNVNCIVYTSTTK